MSLIFDMFSFFVSQWNLVCPLPRGGRRCSQLFRVHGWLELKVLSVGVHQHWQMGWRSGPWHWFPLWRTQLVERFAICLIPSSILEHCKHNFFSWQDQLHSDTDTGARYTNDYDLNCDQPLAMNRWCGKWITLRNPFLCFITLFQTGRLVFFVSKGWKTNYMTTSVDLSMQCLVHLQILTSFFFLWECLMHAKKNKKK